jgi:hypothetical protein
MPEIMTTLRQTRPKRHWSLFVAALLLAGVPVGLRAGEPIQFSNGKILPKAKQGSQLTKDIESSPGQGMGSQGMGSKGFEMVVPFYGLANLDPKEEKRRQEAMLEKQNWMILDQGELQEAREDEERFGLRDDSIEKDRNVGDYWFSQTKDDADRGPGSGRGSTATKRLPGQSRALPPGANRGQRGAPANRKEPEGGTSGSSPAGSAGQGTHIADELNPHSLFSTDRSSGSAGDKSALSFRDLFGGSAADQNARVDSSPLKGLGSGQARSSMGFDSRLDVKPPAALPAFTPAAPGSFDNSSRSLAGGSAFDQAASGSSFRSGGSFGSAVDGAYSPSGSGFNSSYSTPQPQNNQPVRTSRDFFERPKLPGQ